MATYTVTIAGVSKSIRKETLRISETANGRNHFSFEVLSADGAYRPAFGAKVIVTEDGTRIAAGYISRPSEAGFGGVGGTAIVTTVTCDDVSCLARERYVSGTIPAGTLLAALQWLEPYFTDLGVTLDVAQVTGPPLPEWPCKDVRLDELLTQIARACGGWVWEFDYYDVVRVVDPAATAAPFAITAGDGHVDGDIKVDVEATEYANRIALRFSSTARRAYAFLTASSNWENDETVTLGGQIYVFKDSGHFNASSAGEVLIGASVNESLERLAAAISLAGGSGYTYGSAATANTSADAYWYATDIMAARALQPGSSGNTISVTSSNPDATWYTEGGIDCTTLTFGADESLSESVTVNDASAQASFGRVVERVIDEPTIVAYDVATLVAQQHLAVFVLQPKAVRYSTRDTGLHPGQVQSITEARRALSGDFVIAEVEIENDSGGLARRTVTAYGGTAIPWRWRDSARQLFASASRGLVSPGSVLSLPLSGVNLVPSSVPAEVIMVGYAANQLTSSEFARGVADAVGDGLGWRVGSTYTDSETWAVGFHHASFPLALHFGTGGTPAHGTYHDLYGPKLSIAASTVYEFSAYAGLWRAAEVRLLIEWFDAGGASLGAAYMTTTGTTAKGGGTTIDQYARIGGVVTSPATAASALLAARVFCDGTTNPLLFLRRVQFAAGHEGQTELSAWAPGGVSLITATNIQAETITASEIATDAITAAKIKAGEITADKMNVSTLSAIAADLGAVTAGSIVVGSTNKLWLNEGSDGKLAIGGSTKATAPFRVDANGDFVATNATLEGSLALGDVNEGNPSGDASNAVALGTYGCLVAGNQYRAVLVGPSDSYVNVKANAGDGINLGFGGLGDLFRVKSDYVTAFVDLWADQDIYAVGAVSAESFTDRTPWPDGVDALAAVAGIKGKDGQVDHATLPDFARRTPAAKNGTPAAPGRDLGAMISLLTIAVQQQQALIDALTKRLDEATRQ